MCPRQGGSALLWRTHTTLKGSQGDTQSMQTHTHTDAYGHRLDCTSAIWTHPVKQAGVHKLTVDGWMDGW